MKLLLCIMSGLNISDGLFTDYAVNKGIVNEANSLMEGSVFSGDFIVLKIAGAIICSFCFWLVYKRFPKVAFTATSCVIVFYSLVLTWNITVFTVIQA